MEYRVAGAVPVLERTPVAVRSLLAGLPDAWLHGDEGPDTFSPFEVVGHLVEAERRLWIPRARAIVTEGAAATFEPFDRFAHRDLYRDTPLGELLDAFESLRRESLASLGDLRPEDERLDLEATHPDLGTVTLRQLLSTWVVHDLLHLRQIARVMAKQYRDEVGPWIAYLRVLKE